MKKFKIAKVYWDDSAHYSHSDSVKWFAEESSTMPMVTTGFVLRNDRKHVVLAQELNDIGNAREVTIIPKVNVTKVVYLKEV